MSLQQLLVSPTDLILKSESGDCPNSTNRFRSELCTLCKDFEVHLFELGLIAESEEACCKDDRYGRADGNESKFPAKVEGHCDTSHDIKDGDEYERHVDSK